MVTFTCNECGDALKKAAVKNHVGRCRSRSVSCIDCNKDFGINEYDGHKSCLSEVERYSAVGWTPPAGHNKGAKKQEAWVDIVHNTLNSAGNSLTTGQRSLLQILTKHDNVPRKKPKFLNFIGNVTKNWFDSKTVDDVWSLLEKQWKPPPAPEGSPQKPSTESQNGDSNCPKGDFVETEVVSGEPEDVSTTKKKKKKKKKSQDDNTEPEPEDVSTTKKQKKKYQDDNTEPEPEDVSTTKKKKEKKYQDDNTEPEPEDVSTTKKKKEKKYQDDNTEPEPEDVSTTKKKKKKKSQDDNTEPEPEDVSTIKKKKKKSQDDNTEPEPEDVSTIKKKKKKSQDGNTEPEPEDVSTTKKKKRKKSQDDNTEPEDVSTTKKKKKIVDC